MAAVTSFLTLDYVARILDENVELLEAIISNDDNLTYGAIVSVYTGPDEAITALTGDGVKELTVSTAEQKSAIRRRKTRPSCYMPGGVA